MEFITFIVGSPHPGLKLTFVDCCRMNEGKGDTAERTLRMVSVVEKLCRGRCVIVWKMTSAQALRMLMWVVVVGTRPLRLVPSGVRDILVSSLLHWHYKMS